MSDTLIIAEENGIFIDAGCNLSNMVKDPLLSEYKMIIDAVEALPEEVTASLTLGGELCQTPDCSFYNDTENENLCLLRGGSCCSGMTANSGNYSIFGTANVAPSPCEKACPSKMHISSALDLLRRGDKQNAARSLFAENPFSAVTGRICTGICQDVCCRSNYDETVKIRNIERFLGDYILDNYETLLDEPPETTGKRIAVIGAGPAGLSAAFYLKECGHAVTVFEKSETIGGSLNVVPQFKLPKNILLKIKAMLEYVGVEFKLGVEVDQDRTLDHYIANYHGVFVGGGALAETIEETAKRLGASETSIVEGGSEVSRESQLLIQDADCFISSRDGILDRKFLNDSLLLNVVGKISVNEDTYETNIGGIFAAGEAVTKSLPVVFAISGGKKAAISMNQYLKKAKSASPLKEKIEEGMELRTFDVNCVEKIKSVRMVSISDEGKTLNLEDELGYDESDSVKEAKRCFNCGCVSVNPSQMAVVLTALGAKIMTDEGILVGVLEFCADQLKLMGRQCETVKIVKVFIPKPNEKCKLVYMRSGEISVAVNAYVKDGMFFRTGIVLGGVSPIPYIPKKAEFSIFKKPVTVETAEDVADAVLQDSVALLGNAYKQELVRNLVKSAVII